MKTRFSPLLLAVAGAFSCQVTLAQSSATRELNERLATARTSGSAEESMLEKEATQRSRSNLPALASEALARRDQPADAAEAARLAAAEERMNRALSNLSPEGRILLAQSESAAKKATVIDDDTPPEIIPPTQAKPQPLKPETLAPPAEKKAPKQAIITADTNFFDPSNSISVFQGNVKANHPDFDIDCEELEIHMKKSAKSAAAAPTAPSTAAIDPTKQTANPTTNPTPAPAEAQSGIEKAIAKGPLVTIIQKAPDGSIKIGKGRHVTYDGKTGDITLRGMPQIQDGNNTIIATSPDTVLVITADSKIRTMGPHQTRLDQANQQPKPQASKRPSEPVIIPPPAQR
jgi:lipopolysaccharide export system protein LptA